MTSSVYCESPPKQGVPRWISSFLRRGILPLSVAAGFFLHAGVTSAVCSVLGAGDSFTAADRRLGYSENAYHKHQQIGDQYCGYDFLAAAIHRLIINHFSSSPPRRELLIDPVALELPNLRSRFICETYSWHVYSILVPSEGQYELYDCHQTSRTLLPHQS